MTIKAPRFMTEYANYKKRELNEKNQMNKNDGEMKVRCEEAIRIVDRALHYYTHGLINVEESMRLILKSEDYAYERYQAGEI